MNIRSGIDITAVERIEKNAENPRFLSRILTSVEQKYVQQKREQKGSTKTQIANTIAGIFAAKEAVSKALQTGLLKGIGFADITIDHAEGGAPVVLLSQKAQKLLSAAHKTSISIAHDGGFAVAVCTILEF